MKKLQLKTMAGEYQPDGKILSKKTTNKLKKKL